MLSIDDLAASYEMRHGYDKPTPWKVIAKWFSVDASNLAKAINRLEHSGINLDANGFRPKSRPTRISEADLEVIDIARKAGNTWPRIAEALGLPVGTVQSRYSRWKRGLTGVN